MPNPNATPHKESLTGVSVSSTGTITIGGTTYYDGSNHNTGPFYSDIPIGDMDTLANFIASIPSSDYWYDSATAADAQSWLSGNHSLATRQAVCYDIVNILGWVGGGNYSFQSPGAGGTPAGPGQQVVQGTENAVNTFTTWEQGLTSFFNTISSRAFWLRALEVGIGVVLLDIGLSRMFNVQGIKAVEKIPAAVIPEAKIASSAVKTGKH